MRAFRLAYDGRPYHGFQRQPSVPTVEGALFSALDELGLLEADARRPSGYSAAGRTDAGVSAVSQTVAFEAPDWCLPRALNGALPEAIRAWATADVDDDFHATHDAVRRTYRYVMAARAADESVARAAVERLSGEHDFHNLTPDTEGTVRTLTIDLTLTDDLLELTVSAGGFPRYLVRRLASLVGSVARGEEPLDRVDRVLSSTALDGPDGVETAPPHGLVLVGVDYPGAAFAVDDDAVTAARSAFGDRYWRARTEARATEWILEGLDPRG